MFVQNIGIWTEIKSIYIMYMYSTSSFLKNQREMNTTLGVLTFFILATLRTKNTHFQIHVQTDQRGQLSEICEQ